MEKFEYMINDEIPYHRKKRRLILLNELGQQGWELVECKISVTMGVSTCDYYIFKRKIQEP